MTRQERADFVLKTLDLFYPEVSVPLQHSDPFTLLIAVLLSAQCTDERVNQVTPNLFALANTPEKMAKMEKGRVQEIIRPCGLSDRKSTAIVALSKILVDQFGGKVPRDLITLETLPGVGHKTASVVVSQAYGIPAFPVDTHIHRLAARWKLSSGKNVVQTEKDLKKLFPVERWNSVHLKIIFYGRQFCKARGHDFQECFICKELLRMSRQKG